MTCDYYDKRRGFSLIELMIAMAVGLVVLGAAYSIFTIQNKTLNNQEQVVVMHQDARAAMEMICREVRIAGYNPLQATFNGITVSTSQLEIQVDLDGNGTISGQEDIIYAHDATNRRITRKTLDDTDPQPFAENIETFTFQYLDAAGSVTALSANVRIVRITIIGRTAVRDPSYALNNGYRTYTLTSDIILRNP